MASRAPDQPCLVQQFEQFIRAADFPCVGAKAALARSQLCTVVARDMTSAWNDLQIHGELLDLVERYHHNPQLFQSFVVVFEGPSDLSETLFERHMWDRLQSLTDKDQWQGHRYDTRVSSDPTDPHFSLSFGGEAFFIVGLHPNAARPARRFDKPVMVFNIHDQFERLRAEGMYDKLRHTILARDLALAGTPNPMLSPFGQTSEARQYSGRAVGQDWVCPFDPQHLRSVR